MSHFFLEMVRHSNLLRFQQFSRVLLIFSNKIFKHSVCNWYINANLNNRKPYHFWPKFTTVRQLVLLHSDIGCPKSAIKMTPVCYLSSNTFLANAPFRDIRQNYKLTICFFLLPMNSTKKLPCMSSRLTVWLLTSMLRFFFQHLSFLGK